MGVEEFGVDGEVFLKGYAVLMKGCVMPFLESLSAILYILI